MNKITVLLALVFAVTLPIVSFASTPMSPLDKVMNEAAISGLPVEQQAPDGTIYKAFPDYGKSKCRFVYGSEWRDGNLVDRKTKEVCNRGYETVPYTPYFQAPVVR